jgi:hypothetical protein
MIPIQCELVNSLLLRISSKNILPCHGNTVAGAVAGAWVRPMRNYNALHVESNCEMITPHNKLLIETTS